MTAMLKITISLPRELVAKAKKAVRDGEATSVSSFIAEAIDLKATPEDDEAWLNQLLKETGGPTTEAERRELDEELAEAVRARDARVAAIEAAGRAPSAKRRRRARAA